MLMETKELMVANRRRKLRQWIADHYEESQAKFIEATGINQGELSGLLRAKSFGETKARSLEKQAGMPPFYLDQLDDHLDEFAKGRPIEDVDSEFIPIKRVDLKISAGISGFAIEFMDGDKAPIFFRKDWLERKGYSKEKLYAIPVRGESMEPSLYEGDLVVINSDEAKRMDGEVYAFNYEGELVIKRLHREAGDWYLGSDNADKRRFPNKVCHENCFIIGRIIYKQSERI